jgi:hypothetical protein
MVFSANGRPKLVEVLAKNVEENPIFVLGYDKFCRRDSV